MNDNIKYFTEMVMPNISGGTYISGYFIVFNDNSELEIHFQFMKYSITDCLGGNQRNIFKKNNSIQQAVSKLQTLKNNIGLTETNLGDVILVNKNKIKTQVIL